MEKNNAKITWIPLGLQQMMTDTNEWYCKARTKEYNKQRCQLHAIVDIKGQILHIKTC